jgi:hypothetical protein
MSGTTRSISEALLAMLLAPLAVPKAGDYGDGEAVVR